MVLDEATVSAGAFSSDTAPKSDYDAYSSSFSSSSSSSEENSNQHVPAGYVLNENNLPRPIPILGRLSAVSPEKMREHVFAIFATHSNAVRRPLTKDECDAISYYFYKTRAIGSWGTPLGAIGGYYRYHTTREEFKFPFYKPGAQLNKETLLGLTGARAVFGWNLLRLAAYTIPAGYVGKWLVVTYAATVGAVGQTMDPRMKDIINVLVRNAENKRQNKAGDGQQQQQPGSVEDYGAVTPEEGWQGVDDSSASTSQISTPQTRPAWRPRPTPVSQAPTSQDPFSFDNASPTAGNPPIQPTAWEQLRKGNKPAEGQSNAAPRQSPVGGDAWASRRRNDMRKEQEDSSTSNDSYSFSQEDRQVSKQRAQEDFDARLERERRGENFDEPKTW